MKYVKHTSLKNKRSEGQQLFIGYDGRARVRYPGRGGWRLASPADLAMLSWPIFSVGGYRGDE